MKQHVYICKLVNDKVIVEKWYIYNCCITHFFCTSMDDKLMVDRRDACFTEKEAILKLKHDLESKIQKLENELWKE